MVELEGAAGPAAPCSGQDGHLEGDAGGDDEGAVGDPLLKHQVVPPVPIAHADPGLARLHVLPRGRQVYVMRLRLRLGGVVRLRNS